MKSHVLRPLWVAIALVLLIMIARPFLVPDDFGVHGKNFTYGYHRLGNIQEWKDFPLKYQGQEYCLECHEENVQQLAGSPHTTIQCENCHGPGVGHPDEHKTLPIDTSREQCLRCHSLLEYPNNARNSVPGVSATRHKRNRECSRCHNPHNPGEDA